MEAMVGEEGAGVAVEAVRTTEAEAGVVFGHEELEALLLLFGEFGFAFGCAVEFGIQGGEGEEELFDGDGEAFAGDLGVAKGSFEETGIVGNFFEFGDYVRKLLSHFERVFDGFEDLFAEGGFATVPEERGGLPGEVEQGHGVAFRFFAREAKGFGGVVGEGFLRGMAGGAGSGGVFREGGFEEEFAAEADALVGEGVVGGQVGEGKVLGHGETVGSADGVSGCFGGLFFGCCAGELGEGEGLGETLTKVREDGVVGSGVSGGLLGDFEGSGKDTIEVESELVVASRVERAFKSEGQSVLVVAVVVGKGEFLLGELALEGEEDVAALGIPVETVAEGVEGVIGGVAGGVAVVYFFRWAEMESELGDGFGGQVGKGEWHWLFAMEVGVPLGGGDAATGLQSEVGLVEEKVEASEGEGLAGGGDQFLAGQRERLVVPADVGLNAQS